MNKKIKGTPPATESEVEWVAIWFVLKRSSALLKCLLYYYPELKSDKIIIERLIEDIDKMLGIENTPDKPE